MEYLAEIQLPTNRFIVNSSIGCLLFLVSLDKAAILDRIGFKYACSNSEFSASRLPLAVYMASFNRRFSWSRLLVLPVWSSRCIASIQSFTGRKLSANHSSTLPTARLKRSLNPVKSLAFKLSQTVGSLCATPVIAKSRADCIVLARENRTSFLRGLKRFDSGIILPSSS